MPRRKVHVAPDQLGPFLRKTREAAGLSVREASRQSGVSDPYLSQIETGKRRAGPTTLQRLAPIYGVSVYELLRQAGHLREMAPTVIVDEAGEIERAYQFVLTDPRFRERAKPKGHLPVEAKRFIVEMYERLSGKKLLDPYFSEEVAQ